jgi:hypothetical protein
MSFAHRTRAIIAATVLVALFAIGCTPGGGAGASGNASAQPAAQPSAAPASTGTSPKGDY